MTLVKQLDIWFYEIIAGASNRENTVRARLLDYFISFQMV